MFKNSVFKCAQFQLTQQLCRLTQTLATPTTNTFLKLNVQTLESDLNPIVDSIITNLAQRHRPTLASAITLVETEHKVKKKVAEKVLQRILHENSSTVPKTFRIGMSGPPGAGKSTFIEVLGKYLTEQGHRVAVLAVDPSSATSGGSILGDKTRMPELSKDPNAYIRPSPARGHLGGVTRSTNEAIVLCEYAGYDIILVETVGVGQSEYAVTNMVDLFVLLLPPGGGDELQGVKRGIVERANILVVTKYDGEFKEAAYRTQYEYKSALKFIRSSTPNWKTKVVPVSSRTKDGLEKFWTLVTKYRQTLGTDRLIYKRSKQRTKWMWSHIDDGLKDFLLSEPVVMNLIHSLEKQVELGLVSPGAAADKILNHFRKVFNDSGSNRNG